MATFYVDYNRGSDSNDGLSTSAPWKELTKIDDAAKSAGDLILLADDSVWEYGMATRVIPPTSWAGTQSQPVTIGKYSPLSAGIGKPTIRWNTKVAANEWTYSAPNNCWQYTAPGSLGNMMLIRLAGTWSASRIGGTQLPLASVDGRYSNSGTTLSLYAPSGTDPTSYYGEVLISGELGFIAITSQRGCVDIEDLRFEYTGTGIIASVSTAFDVRVNMRRIDGEFVSRLLATTSSSFGQLYASISDCNITEWAACAIQTLGTSGTKDIVIRGNTITNGMRVFAQGAIYLQASGGGLVTRVHENTISGVRWGTPGKTTDGCAIYAEASSADVDVYQNTIYDAVCAFMDNSGNATRWFSNLVYDCKTAMRCGDVEGAGLMDHQFFNNTCVIGADKESMAEFGGYPSESGWRGYLQTGTITSISVKNNVFVNVGDVQDAAILTPTVTPSASSYINNAVSGGYTDVARRALTPFTVETSTDSITSDPLLSATYRPKAGSPLLQAGTFISYASRDINNVQRPNPPSIGAYDVATMRSTD